MSDMEVTASTEVATTTPSNAGAEAAQSQPQGDSIASRAERALSGNEPTGTTPASTGEAPAAPAIPAYVPDFKYKVFREEKTLDPRVHALIKSKEDEEWVKKVFSAADGVEVYKQTAQQEKSQRQTVMKTVNEVLKAADLGDYGAVLRHAGVDTKDAKRLIQGLGLPKEDVIKVAYELATLTPELEAAYGKQVLTERQAKEAQLNAQSYQARIEALEVRERAQELNSALAHPQVAPLVQAYDQTHGPGAFWEEVKSYGELVFYKTKQDLSVAEAVSAVAKRLSGYQAAAPQVPPTTMGAAPPAKAPQTPQELPVIPTVGTAGSQTPAKKKVTSLADIEREYQSL